MGKAACALRCLRRVPLCEVRGAVREVPAGVRQRVRAWGELAVIPCSLGTEAKLVRARFLLERGRFSPAGSGHGHGLKAGAPPPSWGTWLLLECAGSRDVFLEFCSSRCYARQPETLIDNIASSFKVVLVLSEIAWLSRGMRRNSAGVDLIFSSPLQILGSFCIH